MSLTPEQFDKLSTKENLKKLEEKVDTKFDAAFNMFASKDDLKEFEKRLDEKMDKKIDKVLTAIDGIAHKHQKFEIEMAANIGAHDRFEKKFTKTNGRVEVLEKKLGVSRVAA